MGTPSRTNLWIVLAAVSCLLVLSLAGNVVLVALLILRTPEDRSASQPSIEQARAAAPAPTSQPVSPSTRAAVRERSPATGSKPAESKGSKFYGVHASLKDGTLFITPTSVKVESGALVWHFRVENVGKRAVVYKHPNKYDLRLTDERGNRFDRLSDEMPDNPEGSIEIQPGKAVEDLARFSAEHLDKGGALHLESPAESGPGKSPNWIAYGGPAWHITQRDVER